MVKIELYPYNQNPHYKHHIIPKITISHWPPKTKRNMKHTLVSEVRTLTWDHQPTNTIIYHALLTWNPEATLT